MAGQDGDITLFEAVELERQRTSYPSDLPALPDLPSARYFDPDFHKLEMEHVFGKTWLYAAHVSELPEKGSYKSVSYTHLTLPTICSV